MRISPVEGYRNISHRADGRFEFYAPYFEISDVGRHGSVGRLIRGRERQANILRVEKLKRILVGCVKSSDVEPVPTIYPAEIGLGDHFNVGQIYLASMQERQK